MLWASQATCLSTTLPVMLCTGRLQLQYQYLTIPQPLLQSIQLGRWTRGQFALPIAMFQSCYIFDSEIVFLSTFSKPFAAARGPEALF